MTKLAYLDCIRCGSRMVLNGFPTIVTCPSCGVTYKRAPAGLNPSYFNLFLSFLVGGLILGAFIWTPFGRWTTKEAIRKGAKVSKRKVEGWIRKGRYEKRREIRREYRRGGRY